MTENQPPPQDRSHGDQRPYQQPQQYGQQYGSYPAAPYGYSAGPAQDHPQATLAFVLGLLSVLGLTILGPFGWYYGRKVVRQIDADPGTYANRGLAMAGMVLGIIGTIFLVLFAVVVVVLAVAFAVVGAGSATRY